MRQALDLRAGARARRRVRSRSCARTAPCRSRRGSRSRRRARRASAIGDVPASNFHGSSFQVEGSQLDARDHVAAAEERAASPRAARGGRAARRCRSGRAPCGRSRRRSRRRSRAGRPASAAPPARRRSALTAPAARARATISATGLIVPSTFDTCATATSFTRPSASTASSSSSDSSPVVGDRRGSAASRRAPGRAAATGTMFEWCSIWVMSTSSPAPTLLAAPRVGDEVDRLGRVAGEDRRRRLPADERGDALARALEQVGRLAAASS